MTKLIITACPTCGSRRIRRVKRSIESKRGGETFIATGIEVEECPACGERLFSPQALEEIDSQRPRGNKSDRGRKSA